MGKTTGRFVWFDLITTDLKAAKAFYGDAIGWRTRRWELGDHELWLAAEGTGR